MDRKDRVGRIFMDEKEEIERSICERKEKKTEKKSCFLIDSILNQNQDNSGEAEQVEEGDELNVVESDRDDDEDLDEDEDEEEYNQSNSRSTDQDEFRLLRQEDNSKNEQVYPVLKPLPIYSALQIPANTSHFLPTVSSTGHSGTIMQE